MSKKKETKKIIVRLRETMMDYPATRTEDARKDVLAKLLMEQFPALKEIYTLSEVIWLIENVTAVDREARRLTENEEVELKAMLSQRYQLEHGFMPGHRQDLKHSFNENE